VTLTTLIKNDFEEFKNLCRSLSVDNNAAKNFNFLAISLNILHYYFDDLIKLFSGLAKFFNSSAKLSVCMTSCPTNCESDLRLFDI